MLFKNKYFFMSTFAPCNISFKIGDKLCNFTNAEAAFQAQKNYEIADKFSQIKGLEAKRLGENLFTTTPDWEHYQLIAMAKAQHEKFKNPIFMAQLKAVEDPTITNDNYWGDSYWGLVKGKGENYLGKILTVIRDTGNNYEKLISYLQQYMNS